jgi:hypothetical protein
MSTSQLVVRHEVVVGTEPASAFAVFTDRMSEWWPLDALPVRSEGGRLAFEASGSEPEAAPTVLVERHAGRPEAVWADVVEWDPPRRLRLTWHPGADGEEATDLTVAFGAEGNATRVALEQTGWEVGPDPEEQVATYEAAWPQILGSFLETALPV